ncbi:uncharacterized protein isoform X2 [Musca autumnalis]|uniref:uncharacterized protein isoform X2 n=1 Tax=Musca autumnalis TaxID=221902 RepID=UPI003CF819AF
MTPGITLVGIYKAIENKYSADITPLRKTLIKKHLNGLIASKEVKNITGRGLTGHLKLVNKKEFSNKINSTRAVRRKTVTNPDVGSLRRPKTTEQPVNTINTVPDYQSPPPLSQTYDFEEPGTSQQLIRRRNMPHLFNLNEHGYGNVSNLTYPVAETVLPEVPHTYGEYKSSLKRKYVDSFRTPKKHEPIAEIDEKGDLAMFTGRHPTYPDELNALIHPLSCDLCKLKMNSVISAKDHYESKSHDKSITNWITKNYTEKGINPPEIVRFYKQGPVGPNAFHCDLCDLKLTSVTHAQQHYAGKKHQMVLSQRSKPSGAGYYNNEGKWARVSTKAFPKSADRRFGIGEQFFYSSSNDNVTTTTADESSSSVVSSPPQLPEENTEVKPSKIAKTTEPDSNLYCAVCNVSARSALQLAMHLSGIKHQKKLKASGVEITNTGHAPTSTTTTDATIQAAAVSLKDNVLNSVINEQKLDTIDLSMYRTPSGQYYCQTCNLTITNLLSLEQHLKGKRHLKGQMEQKAMAAIANVKRK